MIPVSVLHHLHATNRAQPGPRGRWRAIKAQSMCP